MPSFTGSILQALISRDKIIPLYRRIRATEMYFKLKKKKNSQEVCQLKHYGGERNCLCQSQIKPWRKWDYGKLG